MLAPCGSGRFSGCISSASSGPSLANGFTWLFRRQKPNSRKPAKSVCYGVAIASSRWSKKSPNAKAWNPFIWRRMLNAVIGSGSRREVWFFHGARSRVDHIQKEHVEKVAAEHDNVHVHTCYSRPEKTDVLGRDYQHANRLTIDVLKEVLPSSNY